MWAYLDLVYNRAHEFINFDIGMFCLQEKRWVKQMVSIQQKTRGSLLTKLPNLNCSKLEIYVELLQKEPIYINHAISG